MKLLYIIHSTEKKKKSILDVSPKKKTQCLLSKWINLYTQICWDTKVCNQKSYSRSQYKYFFIQDQNLIIWYAILIHFKALSPYLTFDQQFSHLCLFYCGWNTCDAVITLEKLLRTSLSLLSYEILWHFKHWDICYSGRVSVLSHAILANLL